MSSLTKRQLPNGDVYVYESESFWNKEKKRPDSRRRLLGKEDPVTGEIVPTRKKKQSQFEKDIEARERLEILFCGATWLLDQIGELTGVETDLRKCFPETWKQILSLAYYLILNDSQPLYMFPYWAAVHEHPYGRDIPSQRSSELLAGITDEERMHFFRLQARRRVEKEAWAYDTTSISTYSDLLCKAKRGHNKEGDDDLDQINLALLVGQESGLPFYYRQIDGNFADCRLVRELVDDLNLLGCRKIKFVFDRGFYSAENINVILHEHEKFIMGVPRHVGYVSNFIREVQDQKGDFERYNTDLGLACFSKTLEWEHTWKRPRKQDVMKETRRVYLHLYYDPVRYTQDWTARNVKLQKLRDQALSGKLSDKERQTAEQYFTIRETPKRGIRVTARQDAIDAALLKSGFFALITNDALPAEQVLLVYRMRDCVEKAFCDVKSRLDARRPAVSTEQTLDGKFFVVFIALIYVSWLRKVMHEKKLFTDYTMAEVFAELESLECLKAPGHRKKYREASARQVALLEALGFAPPV